MSDSETSSSSSSSSPEPETQKQQESEEKIILSHAEKRRQKKKEKLDAKRKKRAETSEGPATKKRKLKDGTSADASSQTIKEKRQNSVWVGNLSFKTTADDLRQFFAQVGEPTRIHMPMKPGTRPGSKPENRGFAYVDFVNADLKVAAIAMSEQPLIGRRLLIKDGDSFEGRPTTSTNTSTSLTKTARKILAAQKQPAGPTLFLGNLSFQTTKTAIAELFNAHRSKPESEAKTDAGPKHGDNWIRKVRMGTFEDSGLCKGFAFVDFATTEDATSVLINPKNYYLDGRKLVVEYASPDAVRRGGGQRKDAQDAGKETRKEAGPGMQRKRKRPEEETLVPPPAAVSTEAKSPTASKRKQGHPPNSRSRPKPGAALALAKRESAAIVPGTGKKIVF